MNKILRFSLLSLLTLFCGISTFAADETIDFTSQNFSNTEKVTTVSGTDVTVTFNQGTGSNPPAYYTTGTAVRVYGGGTITLSSTKKITKAVFTFSTSNAPTTDDVADKGTYSYSTQTWTGSETSFTLTRPTGSGSGHWRLQKVVVTTEGAATTIDAPTISGTTPFVGSTEVTITGATGSTIYYTLDNTDPTTSSTLKGISPLTFTLDKSETVKAIAVLGTLTSTVASKDFTITTYEDATIASLNTLTADKQYVNLKLTNTKVVYVDGSSVYVREGDNAINFYNTGLSALTLNSTVSGTVKVDFALYNKIPEAKKNSDTNADGLMITPSTDTALDPVSSTVSDLLAFKHIADLVKLTGVTITSEVPSRATKTNYYANSGTDKIQLYGNDAVLPNPIDANKTYTVVAVFNTIYNGAAEVKPISVTEETPTGINAITTNGDNTNSPIFNLAGQRVSKSYKGIIIQNGKKILNK